MANKINQPSPLTVDSLIESMIALAIRKHGSNCVFTMDSRLACSCGADLHNAKVQGTSIHLRAALNPQTTIIQNSTEKPREYRAVPLPEPVPAMDPPDPTEPAKANPAPHYETGTATPPLDMTLPMAPEQPAHAAQHGGKPPVKKGK